MEICEKTNRLAEAAFRSIMSKNHDYYVVKDLMPGAQTVMKTDKGTVQSEIARWDRLPKRQKRCVWFAIDWGNGKKYYELLSDREKAVVHTDVYKGDIPLTLTYDADASEESGVDVYTSKESTRSEAAKTSEEVTEGTSGFEESGGGIINHDKLERMLENGQQAEFENVPKSTVDECFRYVRKGYVRKARERDNGNYDLIIS